MSKHCFILLFTLTAAYGCSEGDQTQSQSISEQAGNSIESASEEGKQAIASIEDNAAAAIEDIVAESDEAVAEVKRETEDTVSNIKADSEQAITKLKQEAVVAQQELQAAAEDATAAADAAMEDIVSPDKPYQLVDGKISENVMEGWRTYNGGGCGACHGKGGVGAVGPNLAVSVTQKLTKEQFVNIVTNGVSGTMMRPHNTNTRVMDNLDNLYAYLVARGDGVLGPGNLIKSPLGKE